jgi:hypothetical protein
MPEDQLALGTQFLFDWIDKIAPALNIATIRECQRPYLPIFITVYLTFLDQRQSFS